MQNDLNLSYILRDCFGENRKYSESFFIPKQSEVASLKVDDFVKLIFTNPHTNQSERMWVCITQINGDNFVGRLDNVPTLIPNLKLKDTIHFSRRNIANIHIR